MRTRFPRGGIRFSKKHFSWGAKGRRLTMPDEPNKPVCASCGAEIEAEPMTEESIAPFVDLVRTAESIAVQMELAPSQIIEMMMRMAMAAQENERIGDLGLMLKQAFGGKVN